MKLKLNRAFRPVELLSVILCVGLLTGCSSEESLDMTAPVAQPAAVSFNTADLATASTPEMVAPPVTAGLSEAAAQPVPTLGQAAAGETPLYNIEPEALTKHPKWGPVLQQLSQSCVAFFAAEKRVPGSVAEMQSKGYVKDLPEVPGGMMFQIDAENYRVRLVSM
ncbi:MAG: hypothetical protein K0Q55_1511 [Verrucomicrobia bacterium]|nr:hypothetical protein [Verrucomicrobiota bacterium]